MVNACLELIWLRYILQDSNVTINMTTPLYYDNQETIHIAANPVFHKCTKHIEIDCHIIREKLQVGMISPPHVSSHC